MVVARWAASVVAIVAAVVLAGCGQHDGAAASGPGQLRVVATTSVLGDITRNVVGDTGQVQVLIEAGTNPHSFQPSAQQVAALRGADIVIANGLKLVPSLVDDLDAAEAQGVRVVRVAEQLDPMPFAARAESEHAHEDEHAHEEHHAHEGEHAGHHGHAHGRFDPHVWLDPVRMAEGAKLIGRRVAAVAPQRAETVRASARQYAADIMDMHRRVENILAAIPEAKRMLVTNHDAFGYFAARYDFEVIGTVLPGSTLSDPSSQRLAELVATIERTHVPAIFAETTAATQLARTVSREVGREVAVIELYVDSLARDGTASTYLGMMIVNAQRIAAGLTTGSAR